MLRIAKWQKIFIAVFCIWGVLAALPNFLPVSTYNMMPSWVPQDRINLGLDLQGGSHLLLQVDTNDYIDSQYQSLADDSRKILQKEKIKVSHIGMQAHQLTFEFADIVDRNVVYQHIQSLGYQISLDWQSDTQLVANFTPEAKTQFIQRALDQSIEIIRRRIDETGTREPIIQRQGQDRIIVQLPGIKDPDRIKSLLGKTAKLTFHIVENVVFDRPKRIKPGLMLVEDVKEGKGTYYLIKKRVAVSGEHLVDAYLGYQKGFPIVNFRFDNVGAKKFGRVTEKNIHQRLAIVLDNKVISAPSINTPILTGSGYIEGGFTTEEAKDLSILLRAGALPAPLTILEERTVGPSLGADSIASGEIACLLGLVFVVIFMTLLYRRFGIIANVSLLVNLVLIMALLSFLQATLTLPGIAGIVLTIGMAVDANVLIFERIKEELRNGRGPALAIDTGYKRAFTTIIDSNLTTFIAAFLLYVFGSGPIRGFSVTLTVGILTSMFTALFLTKAIIAYWVNRKKPDTLNFVQILPQKTKLDFIGMRKVCIVISAIMLLGSIGFMSTKGLNYGIDFKGGILIEIRTSENNQIAFYRDKLEALNVGEVQLQEFGKPTDILIRIQEQDGGEKERMTAISKIKTALGNDVEYRRVEFVGPQVGEELKSSGLWAVISALAAILMYIWFRFEWQFGLGALVALLHDIILTIGLYSLLSLDFNLSILAAILTIAGYSINDTVVVFDRIRENLRKYKKKSLGAVLNMAINETLSRTAMTSITTLIALFALFFFGGEIIRNFSFAMIWGVVIGTFSSIFIASPLLLLFNLRSSSEETKNI